MTNSVHETTATVFVEDESPMQRAQIEVQPRDGNKLIARDRWPDVASILPEPDSSLSQRIIDPSVHPLLTDRVQETSERLDTFATVFIEDGSPVRRTTIEVQPHDDNKLIVREQWTDVASMPLPELSLSLSTEPQRTNDPSVRPLLTDRVQETLERLDTLLRFEARRSHISVNRIEASGFFDPEEDVKQVVVTLWVAVSAKAALAFWDTLARSFDDWLGFLPDSLARVADERIAVEVRWDTDG